MCLYPKLIKNRKYLPNKKNGFKPPILKDQRTLYVPIGCGNCIECRKQLSRSWQVRLNEEIKHNQTGVMVTLTFNDESLEELKIDQETGEINEEIEDNKLATIAVRRFLERWRKKHKKSVRHWLVTELGQTETERIHLHGIIWTKHKEDIEPIWKYGFITIGNGKHSYVNEKTVNYIVKYITKIDDTHKGYKSKILTSSGIGHQYTKSIDSRINSYKNIDTLEYYRTKKGTKLNLPIYYRNKLFTEEQREQLWINRLDKNERWVCGNKCNISKDDKEYYNLLNIYRAKNKMLGYGDDSQTWSKESYQQQRNLLNEFRTKGKTKGV